MKRILTALLCMLLCLSLCACQISDYKRADELFARGKYEDAAELYDMLGDYRDAEDQLDECKYLLAQEAFSDKNWEEALADFSALGRYKDAKTKVNDCKYQIGKAAYENGDWEKAVEYLTGLDYTDSETMLAEATRAMEMGDKADNAFLEDMQKSVSYRMNAVNSGSADLSTVVNTELSYVEQYKNAEFYDSNLKKIAANYIDGLLLQKSAESKSTMHEYYLAWYEGVEKRYGAITELYNDYGFMNDNSGVKTNFVDVYPRMIHYVDALNAIDSDIQTQIYAADSIWQGNWARGTLEATFVNHTKYAYDIYFDIDFIDDNGNTYASDTAFYNFAQPGETFTVSVEVPDKNRLADIYFEGYYLVYMDYLD